jgi:prevent-host-death family protein
MRRNHRKNGKPAGKQIVEDPRRLGDEDISIADLRARLGDLVARVSYKHDRVVVTKHGKPVAALISVEDLEFFEKLEDRMDVEAAKRADAEARKKGTIPLDDALRQLGLRSRSDAAHS